MNELKKEKKNTNWKRKRNHVHTFLRGTNKIITITRNLGATECERELERIPKRAAAATAATEWKQSPRFINISLSISYSVHAVSHSHMHTIHVGSFDYMHFQSIAHNYLCKFSTWTVWTLWTKERAYIIIEQNLVPNVIYISGSHAKLHHNDICVVKRKSKPNAPLPSLLFGELTL